LPRPREDQQPAVSDPDIAYRLLAAIRDDFVVDLCTIVDVAKAGALDRADVQEHVLAAIAALQRF
jgi:hypothetical protein